MLLMSHFDKTVTDIGDYYHQGSTDRHMNQESKDSENQRQLNVLKHLDDIQSPED